MSLSLVPLSVFRFRASGIPSPSKVHFRGSGILSTVFSITPLVTLDNCSAAQASVLVPLFSSGKLLGSLTLPLSPSLLPLLACVWDGISFLVLSFRRSSTGIWWCSGNLLSVLLTGRTVPGIVSLGVSAYPHPSVSSPTGA
eukprot:GHVT01090211.1.p2 GENE.GHVT01090211.1~~GHVT01090211.1.p2  ORF type:complete len:141 (+),score=3.27 GHVT01090211.1:120-542(+)